MMRLRTLLLAAAIALPAAPTLAEDLGAGRPAPAELSPDQRTLYREVFAAIDASDWLGASAKLAAAPEGPLHSIAYAELYLAKGSPKVELEPLLSLLAKAPEMPKADQIARLAAARGGTELPALPQTQSLIWQGGQPRRERAKATNGDLAAAELEKLVQPLIVADQPREAEALLVQQEAMLTPEARTEFQQRIGWSYYLLGMDADARRLSELARFGSGDWSVHGTWVSGLASWRMKDCRAAADAFGNVAGRSSDVELVAAAHYWASRAEMVCARPQQVQGRLRSAARHGETFYGLLAASALGIRTVNHTGLHDYKDREWVGIARKPNVRAAIALAEIDRDALADQLIRHQARIGGPGEHSALLHLAADLNLASTQYYLAHHAPRGATVNVAARYPRPDWRPARGWRVDQALTLAHVLKESDFRTRVVSPAGAVGLMQVRPGTAGDMAKKHGQPFHPSQLTDPASNLEFGQSYLEHLRDMGATGGLLPKVIAAFNAGPAPVIAWNARAFDRGDPLLYIESIPYWETRGYVPIVLRNYWVYEQASGKASVSRHALAQGLWPRFPGLPGANAVRIQPNGTTGQGTD
jgi:soluble lytic murein transglycosylase-like protein